MTILNAIDQRLTGALDYDKNVVQAPAALLWPDAARQWEPLIERLATRRAVLVLGDYDGQRTGPAYWIRCAVARTVDVGLPDGAPIVYLPGFARSDVRAVETCPAPLAPLAELQYRGAWFSHPNGKDWSLRSLLRHPERGLGLAVAEDGATQDALRLALPELLDLPVARVSTGLIDAGFLNDLIMPDPVRSLLDWLDDPSGYRARLNDGHWITFVQQCKTDFALDPDNDGVLAAATKLGERHGVWGQVWARYAENPPGYPRIPERLRNAKPLDLRPLSDSWPQDNEEAEADVRRKLSALRTASVQQARAAVAELEHAHRERRGWVWADMDLSPLAFAIEQLARLAETTQGPPARSTLAALTSSYATAGWQADDALLRALHAAPDPKDRSAVAAAADTLYRPWADAHATALQEAIGPLANNHEYTVDPVSPTPPGTVVVFVDGLRFDLGHRLAQRLHDRGLHVEITPRLAALPTVTPTAKPAVAPVDPSSLTSGSKLAAAAAGSGKDITAQSLRALISQEGIEVLGADELGNPAGTAWAEAGEIDRRGHSLGDRLVDYLDHEVDQIARRISELVGAGWHRIEIVTDHGWLLLPDGMPKAELPAAVAEIKKGRCARLKAGADVGVPTVPWHWDHDVRIALAPGIHCFESNKEYEHGGVSPQECITPQLVVTAEPETRLDTGVSIDTVKWLNLLCRVEINAGAQQVTIDLRGMPANPATTIAQVAKQTTSTGRVSLLVPDETLEGERAYVVVLDIGGQVLAQREVRVAVNQ